MKRMHAGLRRVLLSGWAVFLVSGTWAQDYPNRPIRIIVPFSAGGANDNVARVVGQKLSEAFGQPALIDNRPGGATNVGTEIVAKAQADGHTLLLNNSSLVTNANLYSALPYDFRRDLAPITLIATTPLVLVSHPSLPVKSARELVALAKSRPGQLTFGSAGIASPAHICGELLNSMAGIKILHVPYKGGTQAIADVLGGQITLAFTGGPAAIGLNKAGKLRAIGITGARRFSIAPDIPTISESGVPGYELVGFFALYAPGGTPQSVIARLNAATVNGLGQPDARRRITDTGAEVVGSSAEELRAFLEKESDKYASLIRSANIRPE
jgi:tripartite-type tricarboxylate transporter receptor subunit TctC